jgi:hypothetical protein
MIRNLIFFGTFALVSLTAADFANAQVTTNAGLKALAAGSAPYIQRAGYYAAGNGGAAVYHWDKTAICTDDGGSCIMPSKAPAQGRWLLNQDGAVSVKVFGAKCDGVTNDTAAFNAALATRSAVFVPANTTCGITMNSSADGLRLNQNNHLYGQNQITSVINLTVNFTPSYNFVAGSRFGNIVVASNVGTVTTLWSHQMRAGQTVIISGSATSALNRTYTIQSVTAPDKFTITTSGVGNGTYTDPTSLTGPSGIGTAFIRAATRDTGTSNDFINVEVDHLAFNAAPSGSNTKPFSWIDMTGWRTSRVHDITVFFGNTGFGQVGFVCADLSPFNNITKTCFFNHIYDVSGAFGTTLVLSADTANVGTDLFERFDGSARVMIDITGSNTSEIGGTFLNWYSVGDGDANSWDIYGYRPVGDSTFIGFGCEGCSNNVRPAGADVLAVAGAIEGRTMDLLSLRLGGGIAPRALLTSQRGGTVVATDYTMLCNQNPSTITLPAEPQSAVPAPGFGGHGGQILIFRALPGTSCSISGNGNTIEGSSSPYIVNSNQTMTMQWYQDAQFPQFNDWKIISTLTGQLPTTTVSGLPSCGAAQVGMMYAVSDAASPTYNGSLTGGGSIKIPVFCNGSAWTAH